MTDHIDRRGLRDLNAATALRIYDRLRDEVKEARQAVNHPGRRLSFDEKAKRQEARRLAEQRVVEFRSAVDPDYEDRQKRLHREVVAEDRHLMQKYFGPVIENDEFLCDQCGGVFDIEVSVRVGKSILICEACADEFREHYL